MHLATNDTAQPPADLSTASLHQVASILISQVISLLRETVTTDEQLTFTSELIPGSTIGKHLRSVVTPTALRGNADGMGRGRHIHDHFRLLLDALSTASTLPSTTPLPLNYDIRTRNLSSETLHAVALDSFVSLSSRLDVETGPRAKLDGSRKVLLSATTPLPVEVGTTVAREVSFDGF